MRGRLNPVDAVSRASLVLLTTEVHARQYWNGIARRKSMGRLRQSPFRRLRAPWGGGKRPAMSGVAWCLTRLLGGLAGFSGFLFQAMAFHIALGQPLLIGRVCVIGGGEAR